jgi:hypothetical protein
MRGFGPEAGESASKSALLPRADLRAGLFLNMSLSDRGTPVTFVTPKAAE